MCKLCKCAIVQVCNCGGCVRVCSCAVVRLCGQLLQKTNYCWRGWLTSAKFLFVDFRLSKVCFVSCPIEIVHFLWRTTSPQNGVVYFLREEDTFRKNMQVVTDFVEKSYDNNGKPWKSSKILRGDVQRFRFFHVFFVFPFFFFFSFFFLFVEKFLL